MTDLRGEQDTDMLTDEELIERGLEPRFTKLSDLPKVTPQPEKKCSYCGRKVKEPITSWEIAGYELLPDDKVGHKGCVQRQEKELKKLFKNMEENDGDN